MATAPVVIVTDKISTAEISSMGIEAMLLAVQANKAMLLEELLKDQMMVLQDKNDEVAGFNSLMAHLNGILTRFGKEATSTTLLSPELTAGEVNNLYRTFEAAGMTFLGLFGNEYGTSKLTKSHYETAVTKVKSIIDNLSNTQQMDMLRVQSISNKRNEAFEMMTTFIKKFGDLISAIIRNMA